MYQSKYDADLRDESNFFKKGLLWLIALSFVLSAIAFIAARGTRAAETALLNYEEFQEIYNTCQKINTDLTTIRAVDSSDPMFSQFSKAAMVAQKRQTMSRWVEEYNAKSRMWNRALWKSSSLPYQLTVEEFSNYEAKP